MKKETTIAIILGLLSGIVIAMIILFSTGKGGFGGGKIISGNITPTVAVGQERVSQLTIDSPTDKDSTDKDTVKISGSAEKNSLIVAHSPYSEITLKSETGKFSFGFPVKPGENIIKITSYNGTNIDSRSLTIYYLEIDEK